MSGPLERLPIFVVTLIVFALPWFFGGVGGAAQFALCVALGVAWFCAWIPGTQSNPGAAPRLPTAVLAAALLLGVLQISPSFGNWLATLDPAAGAVARDFAAVPAGDAPADHPMLSLHAVSTRRQLAALLMATSAFLLGARLFGRTGPLLALLSITTITGGAVAFFGLLQKLSWNGLIYWKFSREGGLPFGPFINRNNAGEFLEIGLAAAVGLLVWRWRLIPPLPGEGEVYAARGGRNAPITRGTWIMAHVDTPLLFCAAAAFLILSGILGTLSRGSLVSLAAGLLGTVALRTAAVGRLSAFAWIIVPFVVGSIAFLGWLGQSEAFYHRIQTLFDPEKVEGEPRLEHWRTSYAAAQDYQPLGAGLGTYRFAYTRMQHEPTETTYYYAENQFLDALLTGGYVGLGLFLVMWVALLLAVWKLNRRAHSPTDLGIATAAAFLVTTQTVHSCFDFGMYLPAVFVPLALITGAFFRRAADLSGPANVHASPRRGRGLLNLAVALLIGGGLAWSGCELRAAWIARAALAETRHGFESPNLQDAKWVDAALEQLRTAAAASPDDGEVRVRLAELLIARYAIAFRRSLENAPVYPAVWQWASVNKLHADAHLLARIQDDATLAALREFPLVVQFLKPALAEARRARELCPLAPYGHLLVAKLCFIDESPRNDAFYLERAERLVGGRADWLYEIGSLHIDAARLEPGFAAWRRSWELSPRHEAGIIRGASGYLTPEQMLKKLVPARPEIMMELARQYFPGPEQEHLRSVFYRAALRLLKQENNPSAKDSRAAGVCALQLKDLPEAELWYRRALSLDDSHADWFFEAAELAVQQNDWETAASHARQALRLSPDQPRYRELYNRAWNEVEAKKNR